MAICSTCGTEGARIRSRWQEGVQLPDECPSCTPQSFEKQTDPSDKKFWIGPEYAPNDYEKRYDKDGVIYMPKPEATHELEQSMCGVNSVTAIEEREAMEKAAAKKRATRRTAPMTQGELNHAMTFIDTYLRPMIQSTETSYDA